jgi:hypothetical protein
MSTAPLTGINPFAMSDVAAQHIAHAGETPELPVRRLANVDQARAIERLGRAVDHLIYSRMFLADSVAVKADADAIHILMGLRRSVFEECEMVNQGNRQMKQWVMELVRRIAN